MGKGAFKWLNWISNLVIMEYGIQIRIYLTFDWNITFYILISSVLFSNVSIFCSSVELSSDLGLKWIFLLYTIHIILDSRDLLNEQYYLQFTLALLRFGKFSRQHFSTSFQKPPWETFCWIVSGMFSQRKDKSRCWMMSSKPTTDACNEWCSQLYGNFLKICWRVHVLSWKFILQRQMDFLEMFWRIREVVIGTRNWKMIQEILLVTANKSLDFIWLKSIWLIEMYDVCYQEQLPDGVSHVSPGLTVLQPVVLGLAVKLGPDSEGLVQAVNTSAENMMMICWIMMMMMMNLGVWRMRKVAVVKIRMTARLCSLLSLCCTVSCLLNNLPWPPPLALKLSERKIGKVDPTFHTDPWLCMSLSLSRLMVLYIWRLSTERIVNGTITEKLTPGHNETGQWQYQRKYNENWPVTITQNHEE